MAISSFLERDMNAAFNYDLSALQAHVLQAQATLKMPPPRAGLTPRTTQSLGEPKNGRGFVFLLYLLFALGFGGIMAVFYFIFSGFSA